MKFLKVIIQEILAIIIVTTLGHADIKTEKSIPDNTLHTLCILIHPLYPDIISFAI